MAEQADLGEDAITVHGEASDDIVRSLVCSLTGTWAKLSSDARKIAGQRCDLDELIFATPRTVTRKTQLDWKRRIQTEFDWRLVVIERQELLAILERPESQWICAEHLNLSLGHRHLLKAAHTLRGAGEIATATSKAKEAERSALHSGDWATLCKAQILLAELHLDKHGLGAEYRSKALEALSTARDYELSELLAECLTLRANSIAGEDPEKAFRLLEEALLVVGDNPEILRWICLVRAELLCAKGDLDGTDRELRQWEELTGGNRRIDRQSYWHVRFRLEAKRGSHAAALGCLNRSLRRARTKRRWTSVGWLLHEKARFLAHRGEIRRAAREAEKAREVFEGKDMQKAAIDSALLAGHLLLEVGAADRALGSSRYALSRVGEVRQESLRQDALQLRTKALQALGRFEKARECNEIFRTSAAHNSQALVVADVQEAMLLAQMGDYDQAETVMESGLNSAKATHAPLEIIAAIKVHWAQIKMDRAQYREARLLAEGALKFSGELPPRVRDDATRIAEVAEARAPLTSVFENVLGNPAPLKLAGTDHARSIQEAHQELVRPLLSWTDQWPKASQEIYDFWGRGNLTRYILNHRGFGRAFHVVVEATTVDEARKWARALCPLVDVLTVLWKGPIMSGGMALVPVHHEYEGAGGWGYAIAAGTDIRPDENTETWDWSPAMGWASLLPRDVVEFLFDEARALFEAGRLFLLPAPLVGCIDAGHGPLERMFNDIVNASPILSGHGSNSQSIALDSLPLPYFPDVPLDELARMITGEEDSLLNTRLALREWARTLGSQEHFETRAVMQECSERIESALADIERRFDGLVQRLRWAKRHGTIRSHVFDASGFDAECESGAELELAALHSNLRSAPWYAFFRLESQGYKWDLMEKTQARQQKAPASVLPDRVFHWLVPPKPGWTIPMVYTGSGKS